MLKYYKLFNFAIIFVHEYHNENILHRQQGKSEGFDSCDRPSNLTQIGFESSIFQPVWPQNLMYDPPK